MAAAIYSRRGRELTCGRRRGMNKEGVTHGNTSMQYKPPTKFLLIMSPVGEEKERERGGGGDSDEGCDSVF